MSQLLMTGLGKQFQDIKPLIYLHIIINRQKMYDEETMLSVIVIIRYNVDDTM